VRAALTQKETETMSENVAQSSGKVPTPLLNRLTKLENEAKQFKSDNYAGILREKLALRKEASRRCLPGLLAVCKVWCRNAAVCNTATDCTELDCEYKADKEDLIGGLPICQRFQITQKSDRWESARHLAGVGELPGGWYVWV